MVYAVLCVVYRSHCFAACGRPFQCNMTLIEYIENLVYVTLVVKLKTLWYYLSSCYYVECLITMTICCSVLMVSKHGKDFAFSVGLR